MAIRRDRMESLTVRPGERLVAVPDEENGVEITRYYVEPLHVSSAAAQPQSSGMTVNAFKQFAGVLSDLDWEEMEAGLEEIRRSSKPSAPIEDV